jgi:hypothetical protein
MRYTKYYLFYFCISCIGHLEWPPWICGVESFWWIECERNHEQVTTSCGLSQWTYQEKEFKTSTRHHLTSMGKKWTLTMEIYLFMLVIVVSSSNELTLMCLLGLLGWFASMYGHQAWKQWLSSQTWIIFPLS